jgi:hypothetical protein
LTDTLFDSEPFEIPLIRESRRRDAAAGVLRDERFRNDYPPDWDHCQVCDGTGFTTMCEACSGMGSLKARARSEAGHRCERCKHPYMPKDDARMLGLEPSWREGGWSPCDDECDHKGPLGIEWLVDGKIDDWTADAEEWGYGGATADPPARVLVQQQRWFKQTHKYAMRRQVVARWRVLTVHHLDGDKANCRWWNLAALCQRCHLEIQSRVVMERVYPHEHSEWFKPHAAGYYAWVYLQEEVTREEALKRMDELLGLELVSA